MKRSNLFLILVMVLTVTTSLLAQQPSDKQNPLAVPTQVVVPAQIEHRIVLSSESSTVRVADPNETVAINGRILRVADVVAVLSSDNLSGLHPRSQEKQTPASSPQVQQR